MVDGPDSHRVLPDKMEQNARVEVRKDGTTIGTRRIIDFLSSGSDADDSVNDIVSVVMGGGSGSHFEDLFGSGYDATGVNGNPTVFQGSDWTTDNWIMTHQYTNGWAFELGRNGGLDYMAFYNESDGVDYSFHGLDFFAADTTPIPTHQPEVTLNVQTDGTDTGSLASLLMICGGTVGAGINLDYAHGTIFISGVSGQTDHLFVANANGTPVHWLDDDHAVFTAPSSDPSADLTNSTITFYLDEAGNKLTFKVKYSGGTAKTGTVNLV